MVTPGVDWELRRSPAVASSQRTIRRLQAAPEVSHRIDVVQRHASSRVSGFSDVALTGRLTKVTSGVHTATCVMLFAHLRTAPSSTVRRGSAQRCDHAAVSAAAVAAVHRAQHPGFCSLATALWGCDRRCLLQASKKASANGAGADPGGDTRWAAGEGAYGGEEVLFWGKSYFSQNPYSVKILHSSKTVGTFLVQFYQLSVFSCIIFFCLKTILKLEITFNQRPYTATAIMEREVS